MAPTGSSSRLFFAAISLLFQLPLAYVSHQAQTVKHTFHTSWYLPLHSGASFGEKETEDWSPSPHPSSKTQSIETGWVLVKERPGQHCGCLRLPSTSLSGSSQPRHNGKGHILCPQRTCFCLRPTNRTAAARARSCYSPGIWLHRLHFLNHLQRQHV